MCPYNHQSSIKKFNVNISLIECTVVGQTSHLATFFIKFLSLKHNPSFSSNTKHNLTNPLVCQVSNSTYTHVSN